MVSVSSIPAGRLRSAFGRALAATAALTLAVTTYAQYVNLGTGMYPTDVSADGSVIVGYDYYGGNWIYTRGTLTPIGGVKPGDGFGGWPQVSNDGRQIVANNWAPSGAVEASRYVRSSRTWIALGSLGFRMDNEASCAWGLSGNGATVVGLAWMGNGSARAFRHRNGVMENLGSRGERMSSRANATNFNGTVTVGWMDGPTGYRQGSVWSNGGRRLLWDTFGNPVPEANVVSDDGNSVSGTGYGEFWRWSRTTGYQKLGELISSIGFPIQTSFTGMNSAGTAMVGFSRSFWEAGFEGSYYWTSRSGLTNLPTLAVNAGIDLQGSDLAVPLGLSGDGRTIIGQDSNWNGFIIRLPAAPERFIRDGADLLEQLIRPAQPVPDPIHP